MGRTITADLAEFVESGVNLILGTRDAALRPDAARACGAVVAPDRASITLFLPNAAAAQAIANLRENGLVALGVSRPYDNTAWQLKGTAAEVRDAAPAERAIVERYGALFTEALYLVGIPRAIMGRFVVWPATAVRFDIHDVFDQRPGPGAGRRVA